MELESIKKVGVVGCGQMGSGIIEVMLKAGYQVVIYDITKELTERGLKNVDRSLTKGVEKGKLTEENRIDCLTRITLADELADLCDCDLVVEAAIENLLEKKAIFAKLDNVCKPETVLASNTSSISITDIASATKRPERVVGMHFFNPVPVMALVEVVQGIKTSPEIVALASEIAAKVGKTFVHVKDRPGFIVNLLCIPYLCEAIRWFDAGLATRDDIDNGIKLGLNHPLGPLALADLIGLDVVMFIQDTLYEEFRDPRYATPPLLRRMVKAGLLGRKSGEGFYSYK
ncbi:MAG: 3-hydroxybutyryl-CoA dehydrogenase [Anaerolineaceae bacterium]